MAFRAAAMPGGNKSVCGSVRNPARAKTLAKAAVDMCLASIKAVARGNNWGKNYGEIFWSRARLESTRKNFGKGEWGRKREQTGKEENRQEGGGEEKKA